MYLSFLIVHYNQPKLLKNCLASIHEHLKKDFEIIVINNSADCDLKKIQAAFPKTKIITPEKNIGFGAGNNLGFKHAKGEIICVLNPDTRLTHNPVPHLKKLLKQEKKIGLVAPLLRHTKTQTQNSTRRFPSFLDLLAHRLNSKFLQKNRLNYLLKDKEKTTLIETPWVVGAAFFIPRKTYQKLNGFDERFFLFFEDTDFCRRIWLNNFRVLFYPQIILYHKKHRLSGVGFSGFFKKTFHIHLSSALKYFWKYKFKNPPKS